MWWALIIVCVPALVFAVLWYGLHLPELRAEDKPGSMVTGQASQRDSQEFHPSPMREWR